MSNKKQDLNMVNDLGFFISTGFFSNTRKMKNRKVQ
jgi:hypothetical protein